MVPRGGCPASGVMLLVAYGERCFGVRSSCWQAIGRTRVPWAPLRSWLPKVNVFRLASISPLAYLCPPRGPRFSAWAHVHSATLTEGPTQYPSISPGVVSPWSGLWCIFQPFPELTRYPVTGDHSEPEFFDMVVLFGAAWAAPDFAGSGPKWQIFHPPSIGLVWFRGVWLHQLPGWPISSQVREPLVMEGTAACRVLSNVSTPSHLSNTPFYLPSLWASIIPP